MASVIRPFPPPTLSAITVDDARAVACESGVDGFIRRHRISGTAVPVATLLQLASNDDQADYIKRAAGLVGYGYGYGDGYGYGYGDGFSGEGHERTIIARLAV